MLFSDGTDITVAKITELGMETFVFFVPLYRATATFTSSEYRLSRPCLSTAVTTA
jgi:hypothetical protein